MFLVSLQEALRQSRLDAKKDEERRALCGDIVDVVSVGYVMQPSCTSPAFRSCSIVQ